MPISKDNMKLYPGGSIRSKEWRAIVERIGERSRWCCEQCKAPHNTIVMRGEHDNEGTYSVNKQMIEILPMIRIEFSKYGAFAERHWPDGVVETMLVERALEELQTHVRGPKTKQSSG